MRALFFDQEPPKDRRFRIVALELVHAARTGQFPFAGPLHAQPERVRAAFVAVQSHLIAWERVRDRRAVNQG